ncbi:MAG: UDP-N-acetylglucosamine--N-acetylmuramyl-(pentapeptide) pyrophosphoryl-undecaprenol N-acetylglucosamine transferase [Candidatus Dormibacteria bacterium]
MAQELRRTDPGGDVLVVGRRGGVAEDLVARAGFPLQTLRVSGLDIASPVSVARFAAQSPGAVLAARRIIAAHRPDVVVGAAGYVSVPVVLAAWAAGVPVVLMEQNALPGRATRLLARRARAVATAFAATANHLRGVRVVHTGNPIRAELLATPVRPLGDRPQHLLVTGGSQGAHRLNRALLGSVQHLLLTHVGLTVTHQVGRRDIEEVRSLRSGFSEDVRARYRATDFIDDVGAALNAADIVLMRAGGSSLAECAAFGRPMILVPYPHAGDHQRHNAAPYVEAGAASLIPDAECGPERLLRELTVILADPARWRRMAAASAASARRDAAARVVALLREVAGGPGRIAA